MAEIANQAQWQGADQEHGKQEAGHEARLGRRNDVWVLMVRIQQWSAGPERRAPFEAVWATSRPVSLERLD